MPLSPAPLEYLQIPLRNITPDPVNPKTAGREWLNTSVDKLSTQFRSGSRTTNSA